MLRSRPCAEAAPLRVAAAARALVPAAAMLRSRQCAAPLRMAATARPLVSAAAVQSGQGGHLQAAATARSRRCTATLQAAKTAAVLSGQGGTVRAGATVRSDTEPGGVRGREPRFRRGTEADAPHLQAALRRES